VGAAAVPLILGASVALQAGTSAYQIYSSKEQQKKANRAAKEQEALQAEAIEKEEKRVQNAELSRGLQAQAQASSSRSRAVSSGLVPSGLFSSLGSASGARKSLLGS
jgi:hypothetical protein